MCILRSSLLRRDLIHRGNPLKLGRRLYTSSTTTALLAKALAHDPVFEAGNFCGNKLGLHSKDNSALFLSLSRSNDELIELL